MTLWNDATKYLRIVALSFFVYDWLCTLPAEIRLYKKQSGFFRMSAACILLILTRYLGLIALCLNIAAFFSHEFTDEACAVFYRFMPITQCFASWASHAVFVVRTSAICNKDFRTTMGLTGFAIIVSGLEMFAQLYSFRRYKAGSSGNCLIQYSDDVNVSWLYYLVKTLCSRSRRVSSLFDLVVVFLTYRGLSLNYDARKSNKSGFSSVLWNSSLLYFATTTVFNLLNLSYYAVYQNSNATVLCAMGIALTSMMSSRVILNLHDYVNRPMSLTMTGLKSSHASRPPSLCHSQSQSVNSSAGPVSPISHAVILASFLTWRMVLTLGFLPSINRLSPP
ncbi:hypothetical protein CPB85DRAFT_1216963 [Mucidula mucida]|nr:hypothetical protein CPB85DRAFT_1216963 [Mucidula mucida]